MPDDYDRDEVADMIQDPSVKTLPEHLNTNITDLITLRRISYYKNAITFKHNKALDGMTGMFIIFSTE